LEYEDVLKRSDKLPRLSSADIDDFLDYLFQSAELIRAVPRLRPSLRDPGDELILELAA
jgi:hypothetical protein